MGKRSSPSSSAGLPPRAAQTRYQSNRGPERERAFKMALDDGEAGAVQSVPVRVQRSRLGVCRITTGFALSSVAIGQPFDVQSRTQGSIWPGESTGAVQIQADLRAALLPLLEALVEGASLLVEYRFDPSSSGPPRVEVRVLVESRALPEAEALREARQLRTELKVALGPLAGWYAFADAELSSSDDFPRGRVVRLQPQALSVGAPEVMGFVASTSSPPLAWLPARNKGAGAEAPLCFAADWRPCLARTLLSAAGLPSPVGLRIRLQRERLDSAVMQALLRADQSLRVTEVAEAMAPTPPQGAQQLARASQVQTFLGTLAERGDCLRMDVELSSEAALPGAFTHLVGHELFPYTALEILQDEAAAAKARGAASARQHVQPLDLTRAIPYPLWVPPCLPDPWVLDRLSFPRHLENVSVALPSSGLLMGRMMQRGFEQPVHVAQADRSRHMYVLGATGTGKSTLIANLARQDIEAGHGVAVIDPHGDLFDHLLDTLPAARVGDVVVIDPSDVAHPVGLNPLDLGPSPTEQQRTRMISDFIEMMIELYPELQAWTARFEQFMRNGLGLLLDAEEWPTLRDLMRIFSDAGYREMLLARCRDPQPTQYFRMAAGTVGENAFDNWAPTITSKFAAFVDNPTLSAMLCAPRRTINYRSLIDERRIVLVNLAKGAIGNVDARMLGMLVSNGLFQAALSRQDLPRDQRSPFYFYLDEFQNFTTRAIAEILAEARKYGLHLVLAHQTLGQLVDRRLSPPTKLVDAVLGNIATKLFMRVGLDEARLIEANFQPQFDAATLAQLPDRRVVCRLLVDNRPSPPFVFATLPPAPLGPAGARQKVRAAARAASVKRYGV
ncbi:MAG: type IV secretory system conjugative DNA transfer family protein [Rubrivivax sp.]|nr:type IV secretory system conjugative DNA transfer family protein [Rubrivivax sp.]